MYRHSELPSGVSKIKSSKRDTLHPKRFLFLPNGDVFKQIRAMTQILKRNKIAYKAFSSDPFLFRLLHNGCLTTTTTTSSSTTTITTHASQLYSGWNFKVFLLPFSRHTQNVYQSCARDWQVIISYCVDIFFRKSISQMKNAYRQIMFGTYMYCVPL